jgi:hypothetical protein
MTISKALVFDIFSLIKAWAVGFFILDISGLIHLLPAIAIFAFMVSLLYSRSYLK